MQIQRKRVYNLEIHGGKAFELGVTANPPVVHNGVKTVGVQVLLSATEFEQFERQMELFGCTVVNNEVLSDSEREEIRKVKRSLADFDPEDLPTERCAMCALCEIVSETRCGVESWQPQFLRELVRVNGKARDDLEACPLKKTLP